jgi:translation elongation factor EF-G
MYRGSLIGHPVENLRVVLTDGASHSVDSSELAFKLASIYAFRQVILQSCVQGVIFRKMDLTCLLVIWVILSLIIIF